MNEQSKSSTSSAALRRLKEAAGKTDGARPLTARAVAELCGVEQKTVHNWVTEGLIQHFRTPGRHLRFEPQAVVTFLETCGMEERSLSAGPTAVLLLTASQQRWLRGTAGASNAAVGDVATLLIAAGRRAPELVVISEDRLGALPVAEVCRALASELPKSRVVVVGGSGRLPRGAERVANDRDSLQAVLSAQ